MVLSDDAMRDAKVLVLANKQDMSGALKVSDIASKLGSTNPSNMKMFISVK